VLSSASNKAIQGSMFKSELASLIRSKREKMHPKSVDFWKLYGKQLGFSFSHYNQIETGRKKPSIENTVKIAEIVKIPKKTAVMLWAKEQMPTRELERLFETRIDLEERDIPKAPLRSLDEFFIFSSEHGKYLLTNPKAWQVLSYLTANTPKKIFNSVSILSKTLSISEDKLQEALDWLVSIGAFKKHGKEYLPSKKNYYLPTDEDFEKIREFNFVEVSRRLSKKIKDENKGNKNHFKLSYAGVLSKEHAEQVVSFLDHVKSFAISQSDEEGEFYELVMGMAPVLEKPPEKKMKDVDVSL
jgi:transcriptional regulator with XRE-family HTH domain